MTIKQQGGIFGRNPTFNDLTVEGTLTTSGTQTVDALNVTNNLDVDGVITTDGLTVNATTTTLEGSADQILQLRTTNSSADNRIYFGRTGEDTRGIIYFQHNGGKLRYDVDSNKIFEVTNASGLAMQRNVSFTAGNGIDFSATSDGSGTTTSELFSDYEEGSWSPTVNVGTATAEYANYTKIGRQVTVSAYLHTFSDTSTATNVQIGGLPFTSSSNNRTAGSMFGRNIAAGTGVIQNSPYIASSATTINLFGVYTGSFDAIQFADFDGSTQLYVTVSYIT